VKGRQPPCCPSPSKNRKKKIFSLKTWILKLASSIRKSLKKQGCYRIPLPIPKYEVEGLSTCHHQQFGYLPNQTSSPCLSEAVFLNFYGAYLSIPRNRFREPL
jgi:hypothetical protein